jgi:hypothetical protein
MSKFENRFPDGTHISSFTTRIINGLTPGEIDNLGGSAEAILKVMQTIGYLGVLNPSPAAFDQNAFLALRDPDIQHDEALMLFELNVLFGIISPSQERGLYEISPDVSDAIRREIREEE